MSPPSVSEGGKGHMRGETSRSKVDPPSTRAGAVTLTGESASPPHTAEAWRGVKGSRTPGAGKESAGAAIAGWPDATARLERPDQWVKSDVAAGTLAALKASDTPTCSATQPVRRRVKVKIGATGLATGPSVALRTDTACHAADAWAGPPSAPVSADGGAGA